eukprot:1157025-Pelagomonas_calceolata.AAC.4
MKIIYLELNHKENLVSCRLDDETCNQALAKSETFVMTGDDEDCNQSEVYAPTVTSISSNPAIAGPRPKRQVHEGMVVECGLSWLANGQLEEEEEPTGTNIEGAVRGVTTRGRRMKEISAQVGLRELVCVAGKAWL